MNTSTRKGYTKEVTIREIRAEHVISDSEKDMGELVKTAAGACADFVIVDTLNFRGEVRDRFMEFLKSYDPDLVSKYEELYQTDYCDKKYTSVKRKYANRLVKEYKVDNYDKMYSYRKKEKR